MDEVECDWPTSFVPMRGHNWYWNIWWLSINILIQIRREREIEKGHQIQSNPQIKEKQKQKKPLLKQRAINILVECRVDISSMNISLSPFCWRNAQFSFTQNGVIFDALVNNNKCFIQFNRMNLSFGKRICLKKFNRVWIHSF